jgi:hypothetical protein
MPQSEVDMCKKIGCQIVYGIGEKLGSSQDYVRNAAQAIYANQSGQKTYMLGVR